MFKINSSKTYIQKYYQLSQKAVLIGLLGLTVPSTKESDPGKYHIIF